MHATVRQTTDAQDLLLVQLQIEAEQTFHGGDAVGFQHNFITVAIIVHTVVVAFDLTADHLLFDIVGIKVFFFNVVNDHAVAQNRQGAALFHHFVQVVADDHNRLAGIGHLVHDAVDDVTAALGKCGGGFVHDQQFGVVVHALGDLDELAFLHVIVAGGQRRVDVSYADLFQCLAGFRDHGHLVDDGALFELIIVAKENILSY